MKSSDQKNSEESRKEQSNLEEIHEEINPQSVEVENAIRKLAENKPKELMEFMAMEMSSNVNPLHSKMNQEHISQVLELASKHDERQYDLNKTSIGNEFDTGKSNRLYGFGVVLLAFIMTIVILILFKDKPEVLVPVLTGLGGFAGGFVGGWGFGKR